MRFGIWIQILDASRHLVCRAGDRKKLRHWKLESDPLVDLIPADDTVRLVDRGLLEGVRKDRTGFGLAFFCVFTNPNYPWQYWRAVRILHADFRRAI
jgi:hypothetical protein